MDDSKKTSFGVNVRRYLLSGLATVVPLFFTFYIIILIFQFSNRFAGKYINEFLADNYGFVIPGLGFLFLLIFVILTGIFVSNFVGNKILRFFERILTKTPIIASIYPSAKKLSDFLFTEEGKKKFRKVVLVEYPAPGSYSIGFLTNNGIKEFNEKTEKDLVTVLVPLSPMPYSGLLLVLPKEKLMEVDMTINEAIKLVLSGGVVTPDS